MKKTTYFLSLIALYYAITDAHSAPSAIELSVWANEAIVTTYSFDYSNYLNAQKNMAQYFTGEGWIAYFEALNNSKILDSVKKNAYTVSAVATLPPKIIFLDPTHWQAFMPVLVVYKNATYQQQQHLTVTLNLTKAPADQGVRGMAISSFKSLVTAPPCECKNPTSVEESLKTPNVSK
ncbi:MAG: DotI/IcmL/TraM family protein [Legionella sp.]|nr:DotI/IcmL/TraM family protein [Legionella sp.]